MRWHWTVTPKNDETTPDVRADRAILNALENQLGSWENTPPLPCSRNRLQSLMEQQAVTLDGLPLLKPGVHLKSGSKIIIHFPAPRPLNVTAEDKPMDILFQDDHLLVLNKPPSLTVHPSDTQKDGTLVNILLHHVKDLSGIGGVLRPGIVHRIDKNTSGALVITKTDQAHQGLVATFARHDIERAYWALCYDSPPATPRAVKIQGLIGRNPNDRKKMALLKAGGRPAVSYYRRIEEFGTIGLQKKPFASWLEVTLETGRTHQIRVHLTSIGHSILGDPTYGTPSIKQAKWLALPEGVRDAVQALPGQALHARTLGFKHPVTGENLRFEAEPPPAFCSLLEALKKYRPTI